MKPMCIYIATRLSPKLEDKKADAAIQYLVNLKQSLKAGVEVWRKGHYPYIPGLDFMVYLELDNDYGLGGKYPYGAGLEWVRRCDAILIENGLEDSTGVQAEYEEAKRTDKFIYFSVEDIPDITWEWVVHEYSI